MKKEMDLKKKEKKSAHVEFMDRFKMAYESKTNHPFKFSKAHFVIAHRLIKDHGLEAVIVKVKILGVLCEKRSAWFTKHGWADFTMENLSSKWNSILETARPLTKAEEKANEFEEAKKKIREQDERIKSVLGSK